MGNASRPTANDARATLIRHGVDVPPENPYVFLRDLEVVDQGVELRLELSYQTIPFLDQTGRRVLAPTQLQFEVVDLLLQIPALLFALLAMAGKLPFAARLELLQLILHGGQLLGQFPLLRLQGRVVVLKDLQIPFGGLQPVDGDQLSTAQFIYFDLQLHGFLLEGMKFIRQQTIFPHYRLVLGVLVSHHLRQMGDTFQFVVYLGSQTVYVMVDARLQLLVIHVQLLDLLLLGAHDVLGFHTPRVVVRYSLLLLPNESSKLDLLALQSLNGGKELAYISRVPVPVSVPTSIPFMLVLLILIKEEGLSFYIPFS